MYLLFRRGFSAPSQLVVREVACYPGADASVSLTAARRQLLSLRSFTCKRRWPLSGAGVEYRHRVESSHQSSSHCCCKHRWPLSGAGSMHLLFRRGFTAPSQLAVREVACYPGADASVSLTAARRQLLSSALSRVSVAGHSLAQVSRYLRRVESSYQSSHRCCKHRWPLSGAGSVTTVLHRSHRNRQLCRKRRKPLSSAGSRVYSRSSSSSSSLVLRGLLSRLPVSVASNYLVQDQCCALPLVVPRGPQSSSVSVVSYYLVQETPSFVSRQPRLPSVVDYFANVEL